MGYKIYCATDKQNGKRYVGKTAGSLRSRISHHGANSKDGTSPMQRRIQEITVNGFEWRIIETVHWKRVNAREEFWIRTLKTLFPNGYNEHLGSRTV